MARDVELDKAIALLHKHCRKVAYKHKLDYEELVSYFYGKLALVHQRWDSAKGVTLEHYFSSTLHGYTCNYLRDCSRRVQIPRASLEIYLKEQELLKAGIVHNSDEDLAEDLGVSTASLRASKLAMSPSYTSLVEIVPASEQTTAYDEAIGILQELNDADYEMLELKYQKHQSNSSIAKKLGLSVKEVSTKLAHLVSLLERTVA